MTVGSSLGVLVEHCKNMTRKNPVGVCGVEFCLQGCILNLQGFVRMHSGKFNKHVQI
jgi:hypothetical protein